MTPPNTNQALDQAPPGTTFTVFPLLPADIRHHIWRIAASTPSSIPGVCILTLDPAKPPPVPLRPVLVKRHLPLITYELRNPSLLLTNTEAYDITISTPQPTRDFNPSLDILYISGPLDAFDYFTSDISLFHNGAVPWLSQVAHLAISLEDSDRGSRLPNALESLPSLKTLSIVYPGPEGEWEYDCHNAEAAALPHPDSPEWNLLVLRKMNEEETREKCVIWADYLYETNYQDFQIQWEKTAHDHLAMTVDTLTSECRRKELALWEDEEEKKKLKLEFRAVVWREDGRGRFGEEI